METSFHGDTHLLHQNLYLAINATEMQRNQLKEIRISGASIRIPTGFCYQIGKKFPLKESDLPKELIIVDPDTNEKHPAALIDVLHFTNSIPSILFKLAEGKEPTPETIHEVLKRVAVSSINQLSFYFYESRS